MDFPPSPSPSTSSWSDLDGIFSETSSVNTPPTSITSASSHTSSESKQAPESITKAFRSRRTLSLNSSPHNVWFYAESTLPHVHRYHGGSEKGKGKEPETACPEQQLFLDGTEPAWYSHFKAGSCSRRPEGRKIFARHLVEAQGRIANWTDKDLEKLAQSFVLRVTEAMDGEYDPVVDFARQVSRHFDPLPCARAHERENRFNMRLEHELGNIFMLCWRKGTPSSIDSHEGDLQYILNSLNLGKFMGDMFRLGIVSFPVMFIAMGTLYTNIVSVQHIAALRNLLIHAEFKFWNELGPFKATTVIQAILTNVFSALTTPLPDFLAPQPEREPRGFSLYSEICRYLVSVMYRQQAVQIGLHGSGPPMLVPRKERQNALPLE
ncbi:hypothetical protein FA15DRAFT_701669 [Coprinopsis marcescibilis]|uniref:Uncharacterized protein n=1 Tax=Coprinopsis marcescibilis TaxID=230819 RepID=A0A5C3L6A1_COPMA|nr:hypothetical protein FA15DRAFT_701669 [Coprinopsis marcescibilis]